MAKWKENNRYDVISVRVTEKEKKLIKTLAVANKKNVTSTVRDLIFGSGLLITADQLR